MTILFRMTSVGVDISSKVNDNPTNGRLNIASITMSTTAPGVDTVPFLYFSLRNRKLRVLD